MNSHWLKTAAVMAVTFLTSPSLAAMASYSYGFSADRIDAQPGETVEVDIYLIEVTDPTASTPALADAGGLVSVKAHVGRVASFALDPAELVDVEENATDFNFNATMQAFPEQVLIRLFQTDILAPTVLSSPLGDGRNGVYIGTLHIKAGLELGDSTAFTATDLPLYLEDIVTADNTILDGRVAPATVIINVVPEPAAIVLLLAGSAVMLTRNRHHA